MTRRFGSYSFEFVSNIRPDSDESGNTLEYLYHLSKEILPNKFAAGPFCRFRLLAAPTSPGVYTITVDDDPVYVGECLNLSTRFGPSQYGHISARNCHYDGQITNCKVNGLILGCAKAGKVIGLWHFRTNERKAVEAKLIEELKPPWNEKHRQSEGQNREWRKTVSVSTTKKFLPKKNLFTKPKLTQLEIRYVGKVETTPSGNSYVECDTNIGVVAFWGDVNNMSNISAIQKGKVPFKATCGCIPSNWRQHTFWIPQTATVQYA